MTKFKSFIAITVLSLLCFLATCWLGGISFYLEAAVQSVLFFFLAWMCLNIKWGKTISVYTLLAAIVLGRIIVELPIRIMDWNDSMVSLMIPIICISSTILGAVSYKEKRLSVYMLSAIIIVLLNTFVQMEWLSHFSGC